MNPYAQLTRREKEIGNLLAWGAIKKEVAERLCISIHTVENHVRNIFEKTECRCVNEFSAWYFCTEFKISFQLSPLMRQSVASILLVLFSYGEIVQTNNYLRCRRCRVHSERIHRTKGREQHLLNVS